MLQKICDKKDDERPHFIELTDRELDVLKLIENGLSNSQVAEKLIVSETIVKNHVSNILSKLCLADRVREAVQPVLDRPRA